MSKTTTKVEMLEQIRHATDADDLRDVSEDWMKPIESALCLQGKGDISVNDAVAYIEEVMIHLNQARAELGALPPGTKLTD